MKNENTCINCVFYDMVDAFEGACTKMNPKIETKRHKDKTLAFRKDPEAKREPTDDWKNFWKLMEKTQVFVSHNYGCIHFEKEPTSDHIKN